MGLWLLLVVAVMNKIGRFISQNPIIKSSQREFANHRFGPSEAKRFSDTLVKERRLLTVCSSDAIISSYVVLKLTTSCEKS